MVENAMVCHICPSIKGLFDGIIWYPSLRKEQNPNIGYK
jgi:hypothetical protein